MAQVVGATRSQHLHGVHPGPPSTTRGQGASPYGHSRLLVVSLAHWQPCAGVPPGFPSATPWAAPPGAYSTSTWATPPGALPGPAGWNPTALANSFNTMALTPPVGPEWVADSRATYHTTLNAGILSFVHPPSFLPSSIMVTHGSCLPITSVGAVGSHGSFRLPDVLVAPSMDHNLLSIHRFTVFY